MSWTRTALFHEQLGSLLASGLPLPRAVELAGDVAGGTWKARAAAVAGACAAGKSLADSLATHGEGPLAVALVRAGEASGAIPETCHRIAAIHQEWVATRSQIISRLVYPVILLHAALVIPVIPGVFLGTTDALWLGFGPAVLWTLVIAVAVGIRLTTASGLAARLVLTSPLAGLGLPLVTANACTALRATLGAGLRVREAFNLAGAACGNRVMAKRLSQAGLDLEEHRTPDIATALTVCGWNQTLVALIAAGEAGGRLEATLDQAAVAARETFSWRLQWTAKIFNGAVYGLAMIVAIVAIFSVAQNVYGPALSEATGD